jgi:hypothetical protein
MVFVTFSISEMNLHLCDTYVNVDALIEELKHLGVVFHYSPITSLACIYNEGV